MQYEVAGEATSFGSGCQPTWEPLLLAVAATPRGSRHAPDRVTATIN